MKVYVPRRLRVLAVAIPAGALAIFSALPTSAGLAHGAYQRTDLVFDTKTGQTGQPADPDLVNPWGLVAGPSTPWWVANNGTGTSTLYNGAGMKIPLTVNVPGAPTGTVFNGGSGFVVSDGTNSGPARFLFASEDGTISGWNPFVPPPPPSHQAFVAVDNSGSGAVYKGLAIASTTGGDFLYAANFHAGTVERYDSSFSPAGTFTDASLTAIGFAPFNVQLIGTTLYVAFAKQDADKHDDVAGPGLGFVDAFDTSGNLLRRIASGGSLNAPWGLAIAPANFGPFSGRLLVGNFGDGKINGYDLRTLKFKGQLGDGTGQPITIDGLWALQFGNGNAAGPTNTLFFTAGIVHETHGLFGSIKSLDN
jgi:uncharacterized protein (TIGR03118 family)